MAAISRAFFKGLIVILPVVISIELAIWVVTTIEIWLSPLVKGTFPASYVPGMAIVVFVLATVLVGFSSNWPTADFIWGIPGRVLERLPVFKQVYGTLRDVLEIMSGKKFAGESVVMVEYPDTDIRFLGIVTVGEKGDGNGIASELDEDHIAVYLPMSFQVGGYTVLVPKRYTRPLNISPADALQLIISGGVVSERHRRQFRRPVETDKQT